MYYTFCGCCTVIAEIRVSNNNIYLYATNCYVQFVHSCIRKLIESDKIYLHCLKFTKMSIIKLKLVVKDDVNKTQTRAFFSAKNTGNSAKRRRRIQTALTYFAARRRQLITVCVLSLLLVVSRRMTVTHQYSRSCRRLEINNGWFSMVWSTYSTKRFKKTFRVSRETFEFILSRIRHVLKRDTINEEPISPECRLAIRLYRLSRGDYYYTIAEMTGLGVSPVCTICKEVTRAIVENMWVDSVSKHMPKSEEDFKKNILDMKEIWQFPYRWAVIAGCHIPIKCPAGGLKSCKEYHSFKNFYSIVMMAMVDSNCRFIWGTCGFPGNSHDAIIFQSTQMWSDIKEGKFIPQIAKNINGVLVPPLVVGDSAFPFQPWLMKPYSNAVLTPKQRYFNYRVSRARMVTEECY